jgi:hypothetical protein
MFGEAKSVMAKDGKQSAGDCRSLPLAGKREKIASSTTFLCTISSNTNWNLGRRINRKFESR